MVQVWKDALKSAGNKDAVTPTQIVDLKDELILRLSENVQGVHVVKGFGQQKEEIAKFTKARLNPEQSRRKWLG